MLQTEHKVTAEIREVQTSYSQTSLPTWKNLRRGEAHRCGFTTHFPTRAFRTPEERLSLNPSYLTAPHSTHKPHLIPPAHPCLPFLSRHILELPWSSSGMGTRCQPLIWGVLWGISTSVNQDPHEGLRTPQLRAPMRG